VSEEGAISLQARGTSGQSFTASQDVTVTPGQTYRFDGMMNIPSSSGSFTAQVQLVAVNQYNGTISTVTLVSQTGTTSGWTPVSGSVVIPANAANLRVQLKLSNLHADVYADGFALIRSG